jgi:hypothetical protein
VGDDVDGGALEVCDPVRPRQVVDRVQRDHVTDHGIGPAVARELGLYGGDRAVARDAEPRAVALIAIRRRGQEVLAARLDPFHRPAKPARRRRQQDVLGIDVPLGAEAAADVGRDHPHLLLCQAQGRRDRGAHGERNLRRRPDRQPAVRRLGLDQHAARLDRHGGDAGHVEPRLDDHLRLVEAAGDVADGAVGRPGGVVGPLVEDARRAGRERGVGRDRRGQDAVADVDGLRGVGGAIDVVGDRHRYGLSGVASLRARHRRLGVRPKPGRGHEWRHRRGAALRQLGDREDRDHAGHPQRAAPVDAEDPRVGVGASHDRRVQEVGEPQVVHVAASPGEKTAIFATFDGKADGRGHEFVVKVDVRAAGRRGAGAPPAEARL